MRLYLTSYQLGDQPDDLVRLVGGTGRVAVISNATDMFAEETRLPHRQRTFDSLTGLGLHPELLDLRAWFGRGDELGDELDRFDGLWVTGGNTFVLRRAFRLSGADELVVERVRASSLAYAGFSAGACLATPSLRGIEPMDEPDATPDGYDGDVLWDGLGLVPFQVVPHYRSDHPESPMAETCIERLVTEHEPFIALRDGETILVEGHARRVTRRRD